MNLLRTPKRQSPFGDPLHANVMSLLCKRWKLDVALKKLQNYLKGGRRFSFEGEKSKTLHFVESFS
jgi:hypothetical protein